MGVFPHKRYMSLNRNTFIKNDTDNNHEWNESGTLKSHRNEEQTAHITLSVVQDCWQPQQLQITLRVTTNTMSSVRPGERQITHSKLT